MDREYNADTTHEQSDTLSLNRAVSEQVDRIVASPIFSTSDLLSRFLRFVVQEAHEGRPIKAAIIGAEVFPKKVKKQAGSKDEDAKVRVEAIRLRAKLREYYDTIGVLDVIIIEIPKGGYTPTFTKRKSAVTEPHSIESINQSTGSETIRKSRSLLYVASLTAALIIVGLVSISVLRWKPWAPDPARIPLTTFPGSELFPAFSVDGKQIAFAWDSESEGKFNIYVKLVGDTGAPLRLTNHASDDISPAWSPDGRYVAFVRLGGEEDAGVYVVAALGGPERKISSTNPSSMSFLNNKRYLDWSPEGRSRYLDWSPDGNWLAIADRQSSTDPLKISLISLNHDERRSVTTPPSRSIGDAEPHFSPDGNFLSFQRTESVEVSDIYVTPLTGGTPRRLTFFNHRTAGHAWMSDGREIIFSGDKNGIYNLWRVPFSGGTPKEMTSMGDHALYPTIARHGSRLAYSELTVDDNIWRADLTKFQAIENATILIRSTRRDLNPQFSPDRKRIAFASDRSGSFEIWVCNADGSGARQVTGFGSPHTGTPRWSPDSKELVFDSRPGGNADIYTISAEGGTPKRLTTDIAEDVVPSWSRDGHRIYFASNRSGTFEVWQMSASGGNEQQVTRSGGFAGVESLDGTSLYFTKSRQTPQLWKQPLQNGPTAAVKTSIQPLHWSSWTLAQNGIYFMDVDNTMPQHACIKFSPFDLGAVKNVFVLPKPPSSYTLGLSVASELNSVLYSQVDDRGSDLVLIEHFR